ncbi:MAG: LytTR family transcriptional regulator [Bacteroidales bacterium]|nr:LytTR family transcriptional regulator [Bacteroidales bacterium]
MNLRDYIPSYLCGRAQLAATVVFAALFAIVTLLVTVVYDTQNWFSIGPDATFGYTTAFILGSIAVLGISKRLMYRATMRLNLDWLSYILWNLAEMVVVALLYTGMTVYLRSIGLISVPDLGIQGTFVRSFLITVFLIGVPYVMAGLYYAVRDRDNTIRLLNYGNIVTDTEPSPLDREKVTLFGEDGVMKLSVSLKNLFYIESDDNYIKVWYADAGGEVKQYMLRCRLKTVEESFAGSPLVRCHRKYIVNLLRVDLISREKDGYYIKLDVAGADPIPISKTYEQQVLSTFNSR